MSNSTVVMHLLQFTDSAFPVGTFSFSNGLESAAAYGLVRDAVTLEAYTRDVARQAAHTDAVIALHAHRSRKAEDFLGVLEADSVAFQNRLNAEVRQMSCRMGRKFAELAVRIFDDEICRRWLAYIIDGNTSGTYPVAQGIAFAACGISEGALFYAHQYGVVNMVLGAALRCVRVSHYDTQRILFRLSDESDALFEQVRDAGLDDICAFAPQSDILASLHEKGEQRLFMN